jgi:DNA-binding NarL/FixJ family response regulator
MVRVTDHREAQTILLVGSAPRPDIAEQLAAEGFAVRQKPESPHPLWSIIDDAPDVVVLLESGADFVALCAELSILTPQVPVIVCEDAESPARLIDAVQAGAVGYLEEPSDVRNLAVACRAVADGSTAFSPHLTAQLMDAARRLSA